MAFRSSIGLIAHVIQSAVTLKAFPKRFDAASRSLRGTGYHFVNESKTWTEAQRFCRQNYTDLATIDNMEEMNRLINTVNGSYNGSAWIGLCDNVNNWRWSLENNDFYQEGERDFRNWYHELDNSGGNQLYIRFLDISKNWTEARRYCRDHYTDLVNVRNQTENQRIIQTVGGGVWIGLYRNRTWSNSQNTIYQNWRLQILNLQA
ncbi:P-selectin [Labeo rohita]|uniref:p-selectin n=1 Tax=Labeo rohita TaxID=84645 RepID=A0ABQ8L7J9_LABRO|nr:P-selectin [Labeo rohita]